MPDTNPMLPNAPSPSPNTSGLGSPANTSDVDQPTAPSQSTAPATPATPAPLTPVGVGGQGGAPSSITSTIPDANVKPTPPPVLPSGIQQKEPGFAKRALAGIFSAMAPPENQWVQGPNGPEYKTLTTGQRARQGIGNFLTAFASGLGEHGPGSVGRSAAKAAQTGMMLNSEYARNQAEMYHNHMTDLVTFRNMKRQDDEWMQNLAEHDKPLFENLQDEGKFESASGEFPMLENDAKEKHQQLISQGYKSSQIHFLNGQPQPIDPAHPEKGMQPTFFLLTPTSGPGVDSAAEKITVSDKAAPVLSKTLGIEIKPGTELPSAGYAIASTQNNTNNAAISIANKEFETSGMKERVDLSVLDKLSPQERAIANRALKQWPTFHVLGSDAQADLKKMEGKNPTGANWIAANIYQGKLQDMADFHTARKAKEEAQARAEGEAAGKSKPDPHTAINAVITKFQEPGELGKPGNKESLDATIDNLPKTPEFDADRARLASLRSHVDAAQSNAAQIKQREENATQAARQGDPTVAGRMLFNRTLTLDELKARSVTPQFIAQAVTAADNEAQRHGQHYNAPTETAQAAVAKNPGTQQFFGNADSLLTAGGTLDQVIDSARKIPGGIPVFNTIADVVKAQSGSGPIAAYAAGILGVADDYSKVMTGGVGSDTSRQQVLDRLNAAQSIEQKTAVINQFKQQILSQRNGRVGNNPYLKDMYPTPPVRLYANNGKVRVYSDDGGKIWLNDSDGSLYRGEK